MKITLEDIFNIQTAVIYYPDRYRSVTSVSIDTRTIKNNSIYVAIKGKAFDGHDFVDEAIDKGAKAIVVSNRKLNRFEHVEIPIISVRNTLDAYAELARIWRGKQSAKVISLTGSNGKTTTKEMIAHLLSSKYKVHKTTANNNNQIGVPLTILSAPKNVDFIVLEHGTNHFGEIEYTARVANPDFSLITNIGNSHTQYLKNKEKILEEKSALFNHTKKDGLIFINNDDPYLKSIKSSYKNVITYGFKGRDNVKGSRKVGKNGFEEIDVVGLGKEYSLKLPLLGESNSKNLLAAISICLKIGIPKKNLLTAVKSLQQIKGRLEIKDSKSFTVIDDTYNSNPESVMSAINVLDEFKKRAKKIVILGDMFELGEQTDEAHKQVGITLNSTNINTVLTIGKNSKLIFEKVNNKKEKRHFKNRKSLYSYLEKLELNDSVVLVKGSRGMKMEEFVNLLVSRVA